MEGDTEMKLDTEREKDMDFIGKKVCLLSDTYCSRTENSREKSRLPPAKIRRWTDSRVETRGGNQILAELKPRDRP